MTRVPRAARLTHTQTLLPPSYTTPSALPIGFQTVIDPADVLLNVTIPGNPQAKERPRLMQAKMRDDGTMIQARVYTPGRTRQAEEALGWIFKAARTGSAPIEHPVGVLLLFRLSGSRAGDVDNFTKLALDAGNRIIWADDQQVSETHVHVIRRCTVPGTDMLVWRTGRRHPSH